LHDSAQIGTDRHHRAADRDLPHDPRAEYVPRNREALLTIAEMTRHVVEHARNFSPPGPHRPGDLERVIRLVRIECAELISKDGFVIADNGYAAVDVIDQIDRAAEVRVPREARVVNRQRGGAKLEIVMRQELW